MTTVSLWVLHGRDKKMLHTAQAELYKQASLLYFHTFIQLITSDQIHPLYHSLPRLKKSQQVSLFYFQMCV
jgi:hypothetical protein